MFLCWAGLKEAGPPLTPPLWLSPPPVPPESLPSPSQNPFPCFMPVFGQCGTLDEGMEEGTQFLPTTYPFCLDAFKFPRQMGFAWHFKKGRDLCSLGEVKGNSRGTEHRVQGFTLFPNGRVVFRGGMGSEEERYRVKEAGEKDKGLERS